MGEKDPKDQTAAKNRFLWGMDFAIESSWWGRSWSNPRRLFNGVVYYSLHQLQCNQRSFFPISPLPFFSSFAYYITINTPPTCKVHACVAEGGEYERVRVRARARGELWW
jgi:hypothetical protein